LVDLPLPDTVDLEEPVVVGALPLAAAPAFADG